MTTSKDDFDPDNGKKKKLVYFSDARLRLNSEVNRHPQLCQMIHDAEGTDWFDHQLPTIVTYIGAVMDETLEQHRLDEFYDTLVGYLREMRYAFSGGH